MSIEFGRPNQMIVVKVATILSIRRSTAIESSCTSGLWCWTEISIWKQITVCWGGEERTNKRQLAKLEMDSSCNSIQFKILLTSDWSSGEKNWGGATDAK